jgi:phage tail sheath protein FI
MRIADRAVRGIKSISELFIGTLNNSSGRMALKERIREYLASMEKEGSLVPSTDGTQPAYVIDVYSTQIDFAQGIVRVDVAVRPVRAMDYIYATITVTM